MTKHLYAKNDLSHLIQEGAINPLVHAGKLKGDTVVTLKPRTTPKKAAECLAHIYNTLPEGGIALQPILWQLDSAGNVTSHTNRKKNPDGIAEGLYDHGTLIVFQKGKAGQPDKITYIDSEGNAIPAPFEAALQQSFPGITIDNAALKQQPSTNKKDCGPNLIRNATAVVNAASEKRAIDASIFTIPSPEDIQAQRRKDNGILLADHEKHKQAQLQKQQAESAKKSKPFALFPDQLVDDLNRIIREDNCPPGFLAKILTGHIPNGNPNVPPTYTPKSLLAKIALDWLELAFGIDSNLGTAYNFHSIRNENSFAFSNSTLTERFHKDYSAWSSLTPVRAGGSIVDLFIKEIREEVTEHHKKKKPKRITEHTPVEPSAPPLDATAKKLGASARNAGLTPETQHTDTTKTENWGERVASKGASTNRVIR